LAPVHKAANIQVCLKTVAVAARMQHQRLPTQHPVLGTPTCQAQAFGVQPLTVGFGYQGARSQLHRKKAYSLKVHQVAQVVARHQVLAVL
jgi:hypothetical protein